VWTRGVDTVQFHPARSTQAWRDRLTGGHPDAPLLLYVGRLAAEKRITWLRPVLDSFPEVRLALVGDGPQRPELEALFADTPTVFTGYLSGDDLADAYAASDLFVFPAANETFGNVVLEAMASGLPVVAAQAGGPLDTVRHEQNGLFFDPSSQRSLIDAVGSLLACPDDVQRLGRGARCTAEARSWDQVFEDLMADYSSVLGYDPEPTSALSMAEWQMLRLPMH
jgi:glycosyltransferase involved in cell wall biosynthesis